MFDLNPESQAWKKLQIKRDRRHEPLVERLCSDKGGGKSIFTYIKDLMIFAAMVGYSNKSRKPLGSDGISIILETYASDQKDSFIYLLALATEKDGSALKDEQLPKSIKIFEEYCNSGLDEIQLWLDENPGDHTGVDTLSNKVYEKVIENEESKKLHTKPDDIDVQF